MLEKICISKTSRIYNIFTFLNNSEINITIFVGSCTGTLCTVLILTSRCRSVPNHPLFYFASTLSAQQLQRLNPSHVPTTKMSTSSHTHTQISLPQTAAPLSCALEKHMKGVYLRLYFPHWHTTDCIIVPAQNPGTALCKLAQVVDPPRRHWSTRIISLKGGRWLDGRSRTLCAARCPIFFRVFELQ